MAAHHEVLTIGHSNHAIERFIELLCQHHVTAVADVRSSPYSQMHPSSTVKPCSGVKAQSIAYSFLGKELGGRPADKTCYENGRVQYRRVAATPIFRSGLDRVLAGARSYRIALMCAECEPLPALHRANLCRQRRTSPLRAEGWFQDVPVRASSRGSAARPPGSPYHKQRGGA